MYFEPCVLFPGIASSLAAAFWNRETKTKGESLLQVGCLLSGKPFCFLSFPYWVTWFWGAEAVLALLLPPFLASAIATQSTTGPHSKRLFYAALAVLQPLTGI